MWLVAAMLSWSVRAFQQQVGRGRGGRRGLVLRAYDHAGIEARWQAYWDAEGTFKAPAKPSEKKKYVLDMFPYPSGSGLHVGHPAGYTASDVMARYWRMQGFEVLHPMGWDAFGLPAEQHAVETGQHPRKTTKENIATFKRQLKALGFSYDWERELSTTDAEYVKWTQWIFLRLFEMGLAEQKEVAVNWCPALGTVLANEEVINGLSERGNHPVVRQPLRQWVLKITEFADELLSARDLDWPAGTLRSQREWIGKSRGARVQFGPLEVFTTRPDTLFGATFVAIAPEHPLAEELCERGDKLEELEEYRERVSRMSDMDRQLGGGGKTGFATGSFVPHPLMPDEAELPVWVADYVFSGVGTGAVMGVPAHDARDFEFATLFDLPVKRVVEGGDLPFSEPGTCVGSGLEFDGLETEECKARVIEKLESLGKGSAATTYKLRDWVFSRQRYWGEPIPIYFPVVSKSTGEPLESSQELVDYDIKYDQPIPLADSELPLELPEVDDFSPGDDPRGCLARATDWRFFAKNGNWYARETNTMPQWAGSCWYYVRFADPRNPDALVSPQAERWLPVDLYVGGSEHAVLHLLYARFWHKVLFEIGVVSSPEPFSKLVHQGMILGADGEKMSKSRGNVVNPDEVVEASGADALRLYEMFMGPLDAVKPWQTDQVAGVVRFRDRAFAACERAVDDAPLHPDTLSILHKTMRKVTLDIEALAFNTAISALMVLVNHLQTLDRVPKLAAEKLALMLSPFAPHLAEECWSKLGHDPSVAHHPWVRWDDALCLDATITLPIQVNGKVRAKLQLPPDAPEADVKRLALQDPSIAKFLTADTDLKKFIYVPGRIVNLVVSTS
ncbi:hypothetical protein CTAYLR_001676 [Chrysophaeum taylorii]|uniref:leucine--tRNA ligase n=1 Tax=Chrysophaeum taylorii TaxID=2483200 RepID=A0AAD7U5C5_9STRA|nr:hypothetical protein CTAYLR_001676 [Chrysophaeum taylorii]